MTEPSRSSDTHTESGTAWGLWMAPALLWVIGGLFSLGLFTHVHQEADNVAQLVFDQQADSVVAAIRQDTEKRIKALQATSALLRSRGGHDARLFEHFVDGLNLPTEHPALRGFWFVDRAPEQVLYALPDREWIGWAAGDQPELKAAMDKAVGRGSAVWSTSFEGGSPLLPARVEALVWPVYGERVTDDLNARLETHQGWLIAVFAPDESLRFALRQVAHSLDIRFHGGAPGVLNADARYIRRDRLLLGTQEWYLEMASTPDFEASYWKPLPAWVMLMAGLLTTLLAGLLLHHNLRERRRIQRQSRFVAEERDTFEEAARHTASAMVLTDADDRIVWTNPGFVQQTGKTLAQVQGQKAGDSLAVIDPSELSVAALREAVTDRRPCQLDVRLRRPSGQPYWARMEVRPRYNRNGVFVGFLRVLTDIDDQRANAEVLQQALAENDSIMRALNTHAIVSETDPEGRIIRANEQFVRISGYAEEELFGQDHRIVNSGHHPSAFWRDVWATITSGQPWWGEVCNRARDGRLYWVNSVIAPVKAPDGRIERYVSIRFDITERKQDEDRLRRHRELFGRMGQIARVGYWVADLDTAQTEWPDETRRILEVPLDGIPPEPLLRDRYDAASRQRLVSAWRAAKTQGEPYDIEVGMHMPDGRQKTLRVAAAPEWKDGRPWRLMGIVQDVTDLVVVRRQIESSERILRAAIEAIDEGFVLYDPQDVLILSNDRYREVYPGIADLIRPGVTFEALVRAGVERGLFPQAVGREDAWIAERLAMHRRDRTETEQAQADGRWIRVSERKTPDGYTVGFRVDITRFKRAVEDAEAASRSKSQFLANMSHEIRTPMNAILGLLQLLQGTSLSVTQKDYATKTEGAARSLLSILNDILDFSKVEAGKMQLDERAHQVEDSLSALAVILGGNLAGKPIDLLFDIAPDLPRGLVYDDMRLKQVLINLGGNAIKFTERGHVRLAMTATRLGDDQADLQVVVEDTGIGIPEAQQQKIFEGFSQAEASTSRRFGGTGLGLAISRRLVHLMGGELMLSSQPGRGSRFEFTLRLPISDARPLAAPDSLRDSRVLLLDDSPSFLDTECRRLRAMGAQAHGHPEVASFVAALEAAAGDQPLWLCMDRSLVHSGSAESQQALANAVRRLTRLRCVWLVDAATPSTTRDDLARRITGRDACPAMVRPLWSTHWLRLLVEAKATSDPDRPVTEPAAVPALEGMRILLAEDNPINQQVAVGLLTRHGAVMRVAHDGQEAVDVLRRQPDGFDVVLMDVQMPVMDGLEATRVIRSMSGLGGLPIIAMTANAMPADREACLAAGMNDHIGKPFDLQQLIGVLRRWTTQADTGHALAVDRPQAAGVGSTLTSPTEGIDATEAIRRLGGDVELYRQLLRRLLDDMPAYRDRLDTAWCAGTPDADALVAVAHAFKGVSAQLGVIHMSALAHDVERAARQMQAGDAPMAGLVALVAHLRLALDEMPARLQEWLRGAAASAPTPGRRVPNVLPQPSDRMALLEQLTQCLEASDMDAQRWLAGLSAAMTEDQRLERLWQELEHAVMNFDFDTGVRAARALREAWVYPSKSGS